MARKPKAATPPETGNVLVVSRTPAESEERATARAILRPAVRAALTIKEITKGVDLNLSELVDALADQAQAVSEGKPERTEAMLVAQAHTLDALFAELVRRSVLNMGEYMDAADRYMRLALKAQGQCRATVETLAEMKNPMAGAYVRQANIAGGHQQVNNAPLAHAREIENQQSKLSGGENGLLENAGTSPVAGGANPPLEALGAVYRASDTGGEGKG